MTMNSETLSFALSISSYTGTSVPGSRCSAAYTADSGRQSCCSWLSNAPTKFHMQVRLGAGSSPLESSKTISSAWKHSGAVSSPPRAAAAAAAATRSPRLSPACSLKRSPSTPAARTSASALHTRRS
eukprot:6671234-Prymnesium_polylepis.1